jgi:endonuclease/exonuclease/phosphatase family metal-dependent hydrolase
MRVLSYNILLGGTPRIDALDKMIRSAQPDIVGLVEATNAHVVEELANRSGMHFQLSGRGTRFNDWNVALLSRLPILETRVHTHLDIFTRHHVLEVCLESSTGQPLTVFVIHLTASMYRGNWSNIKRRIEVQKLLDIMASRQGTPHLVMGDFNSLAPGDTFEASTILRYLLQSRSAKRLPRSLRGRIALAIIKSLLKGPPGTWLLDRLAYRYTKGGIDLILQAGYVDSFRHLHPDQLGFTYPAAIPAARIDYIFASPELASSLQRCEVITAGEEVLGKEASDHLPVLAEFVSNLSAQ